MECIGAVSPHDFVSVPSIVGRQLRDVSDIYTEKCDMSVEHNTIVKCFSQKSCSTICSPESCDVRQCKNSALMF